MRVNVEIPQSIDCTEIGPNREDCSCEQSAGIHHVNVLFGLLVPSPLGPDKLPPVMGMANLVPAGPGPVLMVELRVRFIRKRYVRVGASGVAVAAPMLLAMTKKAEINMLVESEARRPKESDWVLMTTNFQLQCTRRGRLLNRRTTHHLYQSL
jgi:hypothetical protein